MVKREDGQYIGLACDTCGTLAPDSAAIIAGHGLRRMGWYCAGGTHVCSNCPHPAAYEPPVRSVGTSDTRVA